MTTLTEDLARPENNLIRDLIKAEAERVWKVKGDDVTEVRHGVYDKIGLRVLEEYRSTQPWAYRAWALQNIMGKATADESDAERANAIMSEVVNWQAHKQFDPIAAYRDKLEADNKPHGSVETLLDAPSMFVSWVGRKDHQYADDEIRAFFVHVVKDGYQEKVKTKIGRGKKSKYEVEFIQHHYKKSSLANIYNSLNSFFLFLHGKAWTNPVGAGNYHQPPQSEMTTPFLEPDQVETLIADIAIECPPPDQIVRLALATVFGARAEELTDFQLHIDTKHPENSTVLIRTRKKGDSRQQPIPPVMVPLFTPNKFFADNRVDRDRPDPYSIGRMPYVSVRRLYHQMCQRAGIPLPNWSGWHSMRRRVVTDYFERCNYADVITVMRWSTNRRELSQLPRYVKTNAGDIDRRVISQNPYISLWEVVVRLLQASHPAYMHQKNALQQNVTFL